MRLQRSAMVCVLIALPVAGCGSATNGALRQGPSAGHRGVIDDPRSQHIQCLKAQGITVREVGATNLVLGATPGAPTVAYSPTPGAAQELQISGDVQGAEAIGSALLYPHRATDSQLAPIEKCLAQGVEG